LHKEGNSIVEKENDGTSGRNVRGDINKMQFELLSERWAMTIYWYRLLTFWREA
jgi:hypothetical protein